MSEMLKPCPFCGSEAKLNKGKTVFWCSCENAACACEIGAYLKKEEAIKAWNRRVNHE